MILEDKIKQGEINNKKERKCFKTYMSLKCPDFNSKISTQNLSSCLVNIFLLDFRL